MGYYDIMRGISNIFNLRRGMVELAKEKGISCAARQYKTTHNTVRKWVNRYKENGLKGLLNLSRAAKHIPHKTREEEIEKRVINYGRSILLGVLID